MENVKYIPGDLVKIYEGICRVKGVGKKDNSLTPCLVEARVISDTENIVRAVDDSGIEPISLTPQILEANGWKRDGGQYLFSFTSYTGDKVELIGFFIEMFKKEHDMLKYKYFQITHEYKVICGCFYCHQLQHLLFGLGLPSELKV